MKIIDNFLEKKQFKIIQQAMMGVHFPWYYHKDCNYADDGISQLTHIFYDYELPNKINGPTLPLLNPILKKLNEVGIIKIKANLNYPDKNSQVMHTDFLFKNLKTAIYYLNTTDGGTKINNKFIKSLENRMVIIPSNISHASVRHTDTKIGRFIINFNYYTNG
jgi:hypothetical protein